MARIYLAIALSFLASMALAQANKEMIMNIESCVYEAPDGEELQRCRNFPANACMDKPGGSSTRGMVACLNEEMAAWDFLLNAYYQELKQKSVADDAVGQGPLARVPSLRDAQRAWIAFRDADCKLAYALAGEGSIRQIAGADCLLGHTAARSVALLGMLDIQMGSD